MEIKVGSKVRIANLDLEQLRHCGYIADADNTPMRVVAGTLIVTDIFEFDLGVGNLIAELRSDIWDAEWRWTASVDELKLED